MRASIVKLFFLFVALLLPILFGWIHFKNYYNFFVTGTTFSLVTDYYGLAIKERSLKGSEISFTVANEIPIRDLKGDSHDFEMDLSLDMEAVTFNVPMTLSILLAILLSAGLDWRKRGEILFMGLALLFLLHFVSMLFVSLCTLKTVAEESGPYVRFYLTRHWIAPDFLCLFKDFLLSYAARFEPFLIALYGWWEVRRAT
jgi:hypothetical protein